MLITPILLAAAAMAQSPSAKVDSTRAAFTQCLRTHMKKSLDDKMGEAEYDMAIKATCTAERDAFRAAVIAFGRAAGDSQKNAEEDADMQIEDYHANFTDKFADYTSTGTRPSDD